MTQLEVIATSLEDAIAAAEGGAHSVEVCIDLPNEGLTPPLAMVQAIRDAVPIAMNVILRPHNDGHVYDAATVNLLLAQVAAFKPSGIQTLVFGAHNPDGTLNVELIRQVAEAAAPLPITVHRALEWSANPDEALPQLIGMAARILTSGPAPPSMAASAPAGIAGLRDWVAAYGEHFHFAAAGGIRLDNIRTIARQTGVAACHVGLAARTQDRVDPAKVRRLLTAMAD